jgi:hypothetical protein
VPDPSVPEYFGYARALQVCPVEPSFTDRKRLVVADSREFLQISDSGRKLVHEMTAELLQNPE